MTFIKVNCAMFPDLQVLQKQSQTTGEKVVNSSVRIHMKLCMIMFVKDTSTWNHGTTEMLVIISMT